MPVSSGNSINRLASFLTANSDRGQYGKLESFEMPQGSSALGPGAGEQPDQQHERDLAADHAARARELAHHRGKPAADPGRAIRSSTCGPSTCAAPAPARIRSSSSSRCSPTARARCVTRRSTVRSTRSSSTHRRRRRVARSAARERHAGQSTAPPRPRRRRARRPRRRPPTTGSVQELLNQAADDFNQAQTALAQTRPRDLPEPRQRRRRR